MSPRKLSTYIFIFIHHDVVEKKKTEMNTTTEKESHILAHTWTTVSDAKALVNKVKQRNYNDFTKSSNIP